MNFITFQKQLMVFPVFSLTDIKKLFPDFDSRRLVDWQKKGYIQKIKREFYCFNDIKKEEFFLYFAANKMYAPSYISLESALSHYSIIPEGVFTVSSVSTKNTAVYHSEIGSFAYRNIKPSLFFGYTLVPYNNHFIRMAEPEKAVLDAVYFNPRLNTAPDFEALRWNRERLKAIDFEKLERYRQLFLSKTTDKRINELHKYIYA